MASTAMTVDPNSNNSNVYLIPVTILGAIALVVFVLRIWTRVNRTKQLYLDDWFIIVAEPLSVANICLGGSAVAYGWGRPLATLTPAQYTKTMKLQFAVQFTWLITLCFVRLSVACSLLRFGTDRIWRIVLYTIMGLQVLISSSYVVIQFGQCHPVSSQWEMVANVKCWDMDAIVDYGWAIAAIYITMDLILSLMPIRLIITLNRSTSEKILIGCLMGLGLVATAVACAKLKTYTDFGKGDPMQATIPPSTFAKLEEVVGIIASCLPPLKAPIEQILKKLGIFKEHELTRPSFVNTVPMGSVHDKQEDQRSSGEGSASTPIGKDEIRVDSVGVKPSSSQSADQAGQNREKNNWDAV